MSDSPDANPLEPFEPIQTTTCLRTANNRRRKLNQYSRGIKIGKGRHGDVYLCKDDNHNGLEVAVKAVKRSNPRDKIKLLRKNYQQTEQSTHDKHPWSSTENSIRKEIAIMRKCRHPNLVRLLEVIDDPRQEKIYIVMEYIPGGPVEWTDSNQEPILTLRQIRCIMRDVILGLEYLHHQGIIHRDIKPANIIYTTDRQSVKIIDFGVAHFSPPIHWKKTHEGTRDAIEDAALFPDSDLLKRIGTPSFLSPEVVWFADANVEFASSASSETFSPSSAGSHSATTIALTEPVPKERPPITKAIDIWSLAITFYCLLFGHTPFNVPTSANENIHHNEFMLYKQICTQDWPLDPHMGVERVKTGGRRPKDPTSEGFLIDQLLDGMLQKNPSKRMSLVELKKHPWFLCDIPDAKEWLRSTSPGGDEDLSSLTSCQWLKDVSRRLSRIVSISR